MTDPTDENVGEGGPMIFGREPVAIAAFIAIVINLIVSFGLNLTIQQIALINAAVVAGLALLVVRPAVTPVRAPSLSVGTTVKTPDGAVATVVKG